MQIRFLTQTVVGAQSFATDVIAEMPVEAALPLVEAGAAEAWPPAGASPGVAAVPKPSRSARG